jgi:hypothetical protein
MSVQREKRDSWRENCEPHTHNFMWPHVSKSRKPGPHETKKQNYCDNRSIRKLHPSVISTHTQIVKKVEGNPSSTAGHSSPLTFLWTFLVFNFNSTFLEGQGLGVINKWVQNSTHFILSSARWSPATVEILAAVRRILSRKYWAGGSAGPISGGQKAQSTTHKASQKIFPNPLSSSPKGFKPSLESCSRCRAGNDINTSNTRKVRFPVSDWEKRTGFRCQINHTSITNLFWLSNCTIYWKWFIPLVVKNLLLCFY